MLKEYKETYEFILSLFKEFINDKFAFNVGQIDMDNYLLRFERLQLTYKEHEKIIETKIRTPNVKVDIPDNSSQVIEILNILDKANSLINEYNKLIEKRDTELKILTDDVWATFMNEERAYIEDYCSNIDVIDKKIEGLNSSKIISQKCIQNIEEEIKKKDENKVGVQFSIEQINNSLSAYGFTNFSVKLSKEKEDYYCIQRDDGTLVEDSLSEGEETFLTFLYFMQMVTGSFTQEDVLEKKILVFDDPISSLDTNVLYIVSIMLKTLYERIRKKESDVVQIFILTHNVFFHKEVSFINSRINNNYSGISDINYWIIMKSNGISRIQPYGKKNPISSSYELLWKELRDNSNLSLIAIQNSMRRIIENFFSIIGIKGYNHIIDYILSVLKDDEDKVIITSFFKWLDDGSHSIPDDLYVDQNFDMISRYKDIFQEIFLKTGYIGHYNMMMGVK